MHKTNLYKGTRPNSRVICAQTYTIKFLNFSLFMWFWIFTHTQNKDIKVRSKQKQNNVYKEMHDAQMHDNEASNA